MSMHAVLHRQQPLHRFGIQRSRGQPVNGLRWEDDQPPLSDRLHGTMHHVAEIVCRSYVDDLGGHCFSL
jgi:hypothetical protein